MNFNKEKMNALKNKASIGIKKTKETSINLFTVSKDKLTSFTKSTVDKAKGKMENSNINFSFMENVHFNFHHFTTVSMIAALAFFMTLYATGYNTATVNAESLEAPKLLTANKEALTVPYGNTDPIAVFAKDLMDDQVSTVVMPKKVSGATMDAVYSIDNYMISIEMGEQTLGEQKATVSVETRTTYEKNDMEKVVSYMGVGEGGIQEGTVYKYNVAVNVLDTVAPQISMVYDDMTIKDTDDFDVKDYIIAVTDNVDGVITDYKIEGSVAKDGEYWEAGRHDIKVIAKDSSGNTSEANLIVRVRETARNTVKPSTNKARSNDAGFDASANNGASYGSYAGSNAIVSAAYAQIGVFQDCTRLVSNALAAAGIYYHGWPAGYLSLGTVVPASQAQPGDLIYYANGGGGLAHIAVYVGGGQAVHGGFNGNQTVLTTAYLGSGPVFIRLR